MMEWREWWAVRKGQGMVGSERAEGVGAYHMEYNMMMMAISLSSLSLITQCPVLATSLVSHWVLHGSGAVGMPLIVICGRWSSFDRCRGVAVLSSHPPQFLQHSGKLWQAGRAWQDWDRVQQDCC